MCAPVTRRLIYLLSRVYAHSLVRLVCVRGPSVSEQRKECTQRAINQVEHQSVEMTSEWASGWQVQEMNSLVVCDDGFEFNFDAVRPPVVAIIEWRLE